MAAPELRASELRYWHPVLRSEELGRAPVRVELCGRKLVVFRTAQAIGALPDQCPHRGAPLSQGHVEGDTLVCPYHGWRWDPAGRGTSPGTPSVKACAQALCAVERLGAIWIKEAGSDEPFPSWELAGHTEITRVRRRIHAPLELVLDNFIEVEHTPSVHAFLGYPTERLHEIEVETTIEPEAVRVRNVGPARRLPWPLRRLFGIPGDALFVDDWTTYFRSLYTVYEQYFLDGRTRLPSTDLLRIAVFFTPIGERETDLFVFGYTNAPLWRGLNPLKLLMTRALLHIEVGRDAQLLDRMSDVDPSLKGRPLGRFDKGLIAARRRLETIYRGGAPSASLSESGSPRAPATGDTAAADRPGSTTDRPAP